MQHRPKLHSIAMTTEKKNVCVTGAGGFIASWVVKLLLSKGYVVHGTVRDPNDKKNAHLKTLEGASDNLKLYKADLLDLDSLREAITGCVGVIHIACPILINKTDKEVKQVEAAVKGTLNVLRACCEAKIKRVVNISSISAAVLDPSWPDDWVKDESCWSDKEYCRATGNFYFLAKTEAESAAFEYGKQNGLDVVTVNPGYTFGPLLQSTLNFSSSLLLQFAKGIFVPVEHGEADSVPGKVWNIVDVRDIADAILLVYEKAEAKGRYICVAENISSKELSRKLKSLYPHLSCLENFDESKNKHWMSSEKLQKLGWTYRPVEETLAASIESYKEAGLLD